MAIMGAGWWTVNNCHGKGVSHVDILLMYLPISGTVVVTTSLRYRYPANRIRAAPFFSLLGRPTDTSSGTGGFGSASSGASRDYLLQTLKRSGLGAGRLS